MASEDARGVPVDLAALVNAAGPQKEAVDEAAIVAMLQERFGCAQPYTWASPTVLVAVNPYREAPGLYESTAAQYMRPAASMTLPPHPYALAARVYHKMLHSQRSQAVLYRGATDAGKSYTARLVTEHLLRLASATARQDPRIGEQVRAATVVLDAFGTAATAANAHASRHATYTELHFSQGGRLAGAKLLAPGLDKHRLHDLAPGERTFHVFYQLLAGAAPDERAALQLDAGDARMLGDARPTAEDAAAYARLQLALHTLGLKPRHVQGVWRVLAALLHLGDVAFIDPWQAGAPSGAARLASRAPLERAAELLQVGAAELEPCLVMHTTFVRHERVTRLLDARGAGMQRDRLVQNMYAMLFAYLVEALNQRLAPRGEDVLPLHIVQLDTPGFQTARGAGAGDYDTFCKNYAAELVHHYMSRAAFDDRAPPNAQQRHDGIELPHFSRSAYSECMRLMRGGSVSLTRESDEAHGMLGDLARSIALVQAGERAEDDDAALATDLARHADHPLFIPSDARDRRLVFDVCHHLGACTYSAAGMLASELDMLDMAQVALLRGSSNAFVARLFSGPGLATETHPSDPQTVVWAQVSSRPLRRPTPLDHGAALSTQDRTAVCGASRQLDSAMLEILRAVYSADMCWSVLCVRPNDVHQPDAFDPERVVRQLHGLMLPQLLARRQMCFVESMSFERFCERYADVLRTTVGVKDGTDARTTIHHFVCTRGWSQPKEFVLGRRRIWLTYPAWHQLEALYEPGVAPLPDTEQRPAAGQDWSVKRPAVEPPAPPAEPEAVVTGRSASHMPEAERPGMLRSYSEDAALDTGTGTPPPPGASSGELLHLGGSSHEMLIPEEAYGPRGTPGDPFAQGDPFAGAAHPEGAWDTHVHNFNEAPADPPPEKDALLEPNEVLEVPTSPMRKWWVRLTYALTWWIPDPLLSRIGRMHRPDVLLAWREKVTICMLITLFCGVILFYIIGFGRLLCPDFNKAWNEGQLTVHGDGKSFYVAVQGRVYDLTKFYKLDHSDIPQQPIDDNIMMQLAGKDLTPYFPVPLSAGCPGLVQDPSLQLQQQENLTAEIGQAQHKSGATQPYKKSKLSQPNWYYSVFVPKMRQYYKGWYVYDNKQIAQDGSWRQWAVVDGNLYDLTNYLYTRKMMQGNDKYSFLDSSITDLFEAQAGSDISGDFHKALEKLPQSKQAATQRCLDNAFFQGRTDFRNSPRCEVQNYLLLAFSCLIFLSIFAKFVSALQLVRRPTPEQQDRFVICHIPCYTESEESLRKTIDSLAGQEYDNKRKLLFIVCDGMIVGHGNEQPTPRIVLDILGVDPRVDPEPLPFKSVAEGSRQLNYGKVYSGLYEYEGNVVPYIVVVKVGRPSERTRPGNRGKRDTQVLLMRYLNRVHFDTPMSPMELEVYHQMKHVIGIDPSFYEYILMVDADTWVSPDGLNRLVAAACDDRSVIAVCGETMLDNENKSWWTMIQVYEYYISHNLAKAFESLFGSVTCLPGCFSLYRVRSADRGRPLFVSDRIIDDYSENRVDTLHKKNLLSLGEDRYLTTLLLKHFPGFRTRFLADASALTSAPDSLKVLMSQRRRWINSTVHNLVELVSMPGLCGFCLFSMRFVVFIDLVGTIILPATAVYLVYLIVTIVAGTGPLPIIAIAMIAAVYGLQAIIFLLKMQWQYIGWMIIYMIAFPLYAFLLPIYSFWHMDDFSWGNTRVVVGEKGDKKVVAGTDDEPYHDSMIPLKRYTQYEQELAEFGAPDEDYTDLKPATASWPMSMPEARFSGISDKSEDYFQSTNVLDARRTRASKVDSTRSSGLWNSEEGAQRPSSWTTPMYPSMYGMPTTMSMYGMPPMYGMPWAPHMSMVPPGGPGMATPAPWPPMPHESQRPLSVASGSTAQAHGTPAWNPIPLMDANPSEEQLREAVRSFLAAQPSLRNVTKRHVREALREAMPNADLASRKEDIHRIVDELLSGRRAAASSGGHEPA